MQLEAIAANGSLRVRVTDSGPGMDAAVQERLFEPFFTTRNEGTGLGLAIVRSVVNAHGGEVAVESAPGRGAVLQCEPASVGIDGAAVCRRGGAVKPLPVLIVEDDGGLREALKDTLELAGYDVIDAADGEAALRLLERNRVGIVVSDVQMKPMDGETLLREIKRHWPVIPVLLMTAYGMIERAVEAMRAGACNYLPKPFEPEVLVAEVARWMLPAAFAEAQTMVAEDQASVSLLDLARKVDGFGGYRAHHRRERGGQGGAGPFHPSPFCAGGGAVRGGQLRRYPGQSAGSHAVRVREGSVHRGLRSRMPASSSRRKAARCCLTRFPKCPCSCRLSCCAVLQEREVERVGGKKPVSLDVRILATSNRDLQAPKRRLAASARTCTTASMSFRGICPPCGSGRKDILPLARLDPAPRCRRAAGTRILPALARPRLV